MIDRKHQLSVSRQAELLNVSRASVYYQPSGGSRRRIWRLCVAWTGCISQHPFMGARMLRDTLRGEGVLIGRKHVVTLMRRMGIEPIYQRPNTSKRHRRTISVFAGRADDRPGQPGLGMDITYIPMARGFMYLVAIMDWASRRVLAPGCRTRCTPTSASRRWRRPCTVRKAGDLQHRPGKPVHQRSVQRRAEARHPHQHGRQRAWRDNVFVERLWRSVKYEEVVCCERFVSA